MRAEINGNLWSNSASIGVEWTKTLGHVSQATKQVAAIFVISVLRHAGERPISPLVNLYPFADAFLTNRLGKSPIRLTAEGLICDQFGPTEILQWKRSSDDAFGEFEIQITYVSVAIRFEESRHGITYESAEVGFFATASQTTALKHDPAIVVEERIVLQFQREHSTIAAIMRQTHAGIECCAHILDQREFRLKGGNRRGRLKEHTIGVNLDCSRSSAFERIDDRRHDALAVQSDCLGRIEVVEVSSAVAQVAIERIDQHLEA